MMSRVACKRTGVEPASGRTLVGAPEPLPQCAFNSCSPYAFAQVLASEPLLKYDIALSALAQARVTPPPLPPARPAQ